MTEYNRSRTARHRGLLDEIRCNARGSPNQAEKLSGTNGSLLVAAWGRPDEDFNTEVPGRLFALDLKSVNKRLITPQPFGNLDGLVRVAEGRYLVSDWNAGKIWYVTRSGDAHLVLALATGAADMGYVPEKQLLIVPQMLGNRVTAYRLLRPQPAKESAK